MVLPQHSEVDDAPANIRPYIAALGALEAERLFIAWGGSQVYLAARSTTKSKELSIFLGGPDKVNALKKALGWDDGFGVYIKVPLASEWCAAQMDRRGVTHNRIARAVRRDVATVRDWLNLSPSQLRRRRRSLLGRDQ